MIKKFSLFALFCLLTQAISAQISPDVLDNAIADEPAEYPGGFPAMMQYIVSNMQLPESMVRDSIEGTCVIRFVVDTDGAVGATEVLKSLTPDCDAEALRVVGTMKHFVPAVSEGKKVPVAMTIPVKFVRVDFDAPKPEETQPDNDLLNQNIDTPPEYPGGSRAIQHFLDLHLRYPKDALANDIQGLVVLAVQVLEDGSVGEVKVRKSLYPSCDIEAQRVIHKFRKFKPATSNGKPVSAWVMLPINFRYFDGTTPQRYKSLPEVNRGTMHLEGSSRLPSEKIVH